MTKAGRLVVKAPKHLPRPAAHRPACRDLGKHLWQDSVSEPIGHPTTGRYPPFRKVQRIFRDNRIQPVERYDLVRYRVSSATVRRAPHIFIAGIAEGPCAKINTGSLERC